MKKHLSEPWFSLVKLGLKTIEGRLDKGSFSNLKRDDIIVFYNDDFGHRECIVRILKVNRYDTFENYLKTESLKRTLPGFTRINDGLNVYYKYFSKEDESKYKIVAVHMALIS